MAAAAQTSGLNHPPTGLDRLLSVVRWLIGYGKELAAAIHQRATEADFAIVACRFGTIDLALILARITRGLRRAAALETALLARQAKGQEDAPAATIRMPAGPRPPGRASSGDRPRRDPDAADAELLAHLPTEQEIAEEICRRSIGAVIVDICHDLGIVPGDLPSRFWDELNGAVLRYGGSMLMFLKDVQTGVVWLSKIITDPFHDVMLYYKAPLYVLRGELIDPMEDVLEEEAMRQRA